MTRAEKIKKLANAIKEYRGSTDGVGGPWIRHPKPSALSRVISWLQKLGVEPTSDVIHRIDKFATPKDFYGFLEEVEHGVPA